MVEHHITAEGLHYVSAGTTGSPILLVHGWPETWWAFREVIPLLAGTHRVFAVDLRGFGDSSAGEGDYGVAAVVADLHRLVGHLGAGPVHLTCQDISGFAAFAFAATHPEDVLSLTAVETSLPGYGLELLADVNNGGSWHVGFLGAPGIPETFLAGKEREMLEWAYAAMGLPGADLDEYVRTYSRPGGWRGTAGLYRALFADRGRTRQLAEARPLTVPTLAVDGVNAPFTARTMAQVVRGELTSVHLEGVGHLVAQEAPDRFAAVLLDFVGRD